MKTIINKITGEFLYSARVEVHLLENEITIDELLTEYFENPYFDFESRTFYNKE
jgi:hypothetical protein